jgi:ABC-2 type transport system permease protein
MKVNNILNLGIKELFSLKSDPALMILIVFIFTIAVYSVATGVNLEVKKASIAVVDEDRSPLSRQIVSALLPPIFLPPVEIHARDMNNALNSGEFVFILVFPPNFERDVLQGKKPDLQLNADASAMTMAGNGAVYIEQIILAETINYIEPNRHVSDFLPVTMSIRKLFNPNSSSIWLNAVLQVVNNVTILGIILAGAALIREREHGTIEPLLCMPVTPSEIMLAKIWANGLVILIATLMSLECVVHLGLGVPIHGSIMVFGLATVLYLFSVTSLGILLGTITRTMAQFGLLIIPIVIVMYLLSGGTTPQDSMPDSLFAIMQLSPSTYYVRLAQDILYRGAELRDVWPRLIILTIIGSIFFMLSLMRFRRAITTMG